MYRRQFLSLVTLFKFFHFHTNFLEQINAHITKSTRRPNKLVVNSHGIVISYLFFCIELAQYGIVFLHPSLCSTICLNSKLMCSQSFCIEATIFMQRHTILAQPYVFIFFLFSSSFFLFSEKTVLAVEVVLASIAMSHLQSDVGVIWKVLTWNLYGLMSVLVSTHVVWAVDIARQICHVPTGIYWRAILKQLKKVIPDQLSSLVTLMLTLHLHCVQMQDVYAISRQLCH